MVAVLALGGGGLYFFLSKKAQREADDAFTMVMNALAGEDMWERGDISYSLLRDTLTVDNVIVRLPDGAPAVRMDLERTVIKGAPEKAEVERLIALESWTSQPAAKLFDSCVFSGVSFQGARGKQISRATIKELNLTGAGLSESGPDPNPYGVATFLSLESLRMEALDALLSSDDGEADIAIG